MKKRILTMAMSAVMAMSMSLTAWAWDTNLYLYEPTTNENGYIDGWVWQDMNGDGVFECYYYENGFLKRNQTTPDGYIVNIEGQWILDGIVQKKTRENAAANSVNAGAVSTETVNINGVNHSAGYDPAHPLKNVIDTWNLRITNTGLIGGSNTPICNDSFQALLTGEMDKYYMAPAGYSTNPITGSQVYISQEDYDEGVMIENALYQWFCNWLNGMDFEHMSEMERAKEIQKVMAQIKFRWDDNSTKRTYYDTLINKEGACAECAMTACSLAKALGLKSAVSGTGDHAVYYIQVDGVAYFGQNSVLNLSSPTPDNVYCN